MAKVKVLIPTPLRQYAGKQDSVELTGSTLGEVLAPPTPTHPAKVSGRPPTPLRQYAGKQDSVELTGSTVGEVLTALTTQHPDLRRQLYNDAGQLRSFAHVHLNDEDIRYLEKDATPVK